MKIVSEQFKTQAKELARVQLAKFTFKDTNEIIDGEYLVSGFLQEQSFANDVLVGNVIAKNLEFSVHNPNNIDYIDKEIVFYTGLYVNGEPTYVKHGSFIIDTAEKDEASDVVKVKAMDYIIKANKEFIDKLDWGNKEYTIGDFAEHVCSQCGLVLKTTSFPNSDYVLTEQPAFQGYQCRYVLGKIAEIGGCSVYLNSEDEVEIKLFNDNESEDIIVDSISEMETTTANATPYNIVTIALANGVEGENVTKRDEESISEYGEKSLIITANEFAINENVRKALIDAIFDNINGFNYTPIKITYNSYDWLDRGDKIRVYYDDNNFYETYLLNHTIEFPSSVKSVIENASVSITNSENQYVPPEVQQRAHTEIIVDKLNNEITSIATKTQTIEGEVEDLNNSISLFSAELAQNSLIISANNDNTPITSKIYEIPFYGYFKGKQVIPNVNVEGDYDGIKVDSSSTSLTFEVEKDVVIKEITNDYTITFTYFYGGKNYTATKKFSVVLATQGSDGTNGKSAYQIWLDNGNTGTEEDYLKSLKGADGKDGEDGKTPVKGVDYFDGENGVSTYFYVRYSANSNGSGMTTAPTTTTKYMGTASTTSPTAPTTTSAYTWVEIKGKDGTNGSPGSNGVDGKTSYLHVKYSDDGIAFTPEDDVYALGERPSAWIGQYVDFVEADSTTFDDYSWYKFTEDIDGTLTDMKADINKNTTTIENTKQEMIEELNKKANAEELKVVVNEVKTLQNSNSIVTTIIEDIQVNGVSQVKQENVFTLNKDGFIFEETGAKTKAIINNTGVDVLDTQGDGSDLLYAGYVDEEKADSNEKFKDYEGQTIVYSNNMIVDNYLAIGTHSRIEDYEDGTGIFYIGG